MLFERSTAPGAVRIARCWRRRSRSPLTRSRPSASPARCQRRLLRRRGQVAARRVLRRRRLPAHLERLRGPPSSVLGTWRHTRTDYGRPPARPCVRFGMASSSRGSTRRLRQCGRLQTTATASHALTDTSGFARARAVDPACRSVNRWIRGQTDLPRDRISIESPNRRRARTRAPPFGSRAAPRARRAERPRFERCDKQCSPHWSSPPAPCGSRFAERHAAPPRGRASFEGWELAGRPPRGSPSRSPAAHYCGASRAHGEGSCSPRFARDCAHAAVALSSTCGGPASCPRPYALSTRLPAGSAVGDSTAWKSARERARRRAGADSPNLLFGDSVELDRLPCRAICLASSAGGGTALAAAGRIRHHRWRGQGPDALLHCPPVLASSDRRPPRRDPAIASIEAPRAAVSATRSTPHRDPRRQTPVRRRAASRYCSEIASWVGRRSTPFRPSVRHA